VPEKGEVAAHLVNLAWNGLSHLEHSPRLRECHSANPPLKWMKTTVTSDSA
jgi:hypothetical protein